LHAPTHEPQLQAPQQAKLHCWAFYFQLQLLHGVRLLCRLHALRGGRHELTALGFRYLLKGTNEQVWILLREYIKTAEQTSGVWRAGGRRRHNKQTRDKGVGCRWRS
jgi:hypothetical protein